MSSAEVRAGARGALGASGGAARRPGLALGSPGCRRCVGRLQHGTAAGRCPCMLTIEDFTRHRPQTVGAVAHLVIGRLAAKTRSPRVDEITTAVSEALPQFRADEALSHRQSVASAVNAYFVHLLPPVRFQWAGAEVRLDTGRVDLMWRAGQDVILDELKTGSAPLSGRDLTQAGAYAGLGWETLNGRFLGVRLVSTYRPSSSLLVSHDAPSRPLGDTGLLAPRSR